MMDECGWDAAESVFIVPKWQRTDLVLKVHGAVCGSRKLSTGRT
jgi:hypothetical protein